MTNIAKESQNITIEDCKKVQDFFKSERGLLAKACNETGLEFNAVRYNLQGATEGIKLLYAVILSEWRRRWVIQERARRRLADDVARITEG